MNGGRTTQYALEQQFWIMGVTTGFTAAALGGGGFFAYFGLLALAGATNVDQVGITGLGITLLVSLVVTRVVAGRLWGYALTTVAGTATFFGRALLHRDGFAPDEAETFCRDGTPFLAVGLGFFGLLFLGFFLMARWSCPTARPEGGFVTAACVFFEPGPFRGLVLTVVRLTYGSFGVAGMLLTVTSFLELRFLWRDSVLQERYRSSSLYYWLHPVNSLGEEAAPNREDADD